MIISRIMLFAYPKPKPGHFGRNHPNLEPSTIGKLFHENESGNVNEIEVGNTGKKKKLGEESGQALIEFIFLLGMVFFMSLGFYNISGRGFAKLWKVMIETIAAPSVVQFR